MQAPEITVDDQDDANGSLVFIIHSTGGEAIARTDKTGLVKYEARPNTLIKWRWNIEASELINQEVREVDYDRSIMTSQKLS